MTQTGTAATATQTADAICTAARSAKATVAQQVAYMSTGVYRMISCNAGGTVVELAQGQRGTFAVRAWGMVQGEYATAAAAVKAYRKAVRVARAAR